MILIPAYRASARLGGVLDRIRTCAPGIPVLVVDDGSDDGTAGIAAGRGARVLRHPRNLGKGAALRTGFAEALAQGATGVLTLDADGQHPPERIAAFLEASARADLVLGCRMGQARRMPWLRRHVNRGTSRIVSALARTPLRDSQCGFRWVSARVLRAVPLSTGHYETESELLIRAARRGFRIAEVPVPAVYEGGESHIRKAGDTLRFLRMAARFL